MPISANTARSVIAVLLDQAIALPGILTLLVPARVSLVTSLSATTRHGRWRQTATGARKTGVDAGGRYGRGQYQERLALGWIRANDVPCRVVPPVPHVPAMPPDVGMRNPIRPATDWLRDPSARKKVPMSSVALLARPGLGTVSAAAVGRTMAFLDYFAGVFTLVSLTVVVACGARRHRPAGADPPLRVAVQSVHRASAVAALGFLAIHIAVKVVAVGTPLHRPRWSPSPAAPPWQ